MSAGVAITTAPFVGRADELTQLEQAWEASANGLASTWILGGEAGVGKTRLVRELVDRVTAGGGTALVGGCIDLADGGPPLWPFVEALGPGAAADPEALADGSGGGQQGRLFELILGHIGRLTADRPLLLVLEDLHWADRSTRDLLSFLARNLRHERIVLVATYRSDDLYRGHPLRAFLAELYRARVVRRLDLVPFTRGETEEHLRALTGGQVDGHLLDSVFERSEGNAFFSEELVAAAHERDRRELPSTLRDILLSRVEHRSAAAQEVLRVAAVGGRRVSGRLLDAICDLPPRERTEALREAVTHHLLVPDGSDAYSFRHALLREAVYQELLPGERSDLHAAFGTALSEDPTLACADGVAAGELAYHWFAAQDLPRAFEASVRAGAAAAARWGFAEAGAHYERALGLWDRVPDAPALAGMDHVALARRAAEAANLSGDHARAAALTRAAIASADPGETGLLWERLGRYLWAAGDSDSAMGAYEEALKRVPEEPPTAARARVLAAHGQSLMLLARFEHAAARCQEAIELARVVGARAEEGHALNTRGCALAFLGDPAAAVSHLRDALEIAREVGDLDDIGRAYQNLSEVLGGPLNRLDEALDLALEGRELAERVGLARDYGVSLEVNAATALIARGRWQEAEDILRTAEGRNPVEMSAIDLHLGRARLDVARGDFAEVRRHIAHAERLMTKTLDPQFRSVLCARRAELALWEHRPADACSDVADGLGSLEAGDDTWFEGPLLWLGAWAAVDAGQELEGVQERAAELLAAADPGARFVSPVTRAYAQLCRAEHSRASGGDAAEWEAAAGAWNALGHPYPEAYASWRAGEALLARRRGREGQDTLRAAWDIARRLRSRPLEEEITALARRARVELTAAEPALDDSGDPFGLTPRERQVLALIAVGSTNREIAQELFVTEKTAGAHVSNILGKLGVRGRVEAATVAHRLGLLEDPQATANS